MAVLLTTAEACERWPNLTPRIIRSWRERGRIQPAARLGRETLWPADRLSTLEATLHQRVVGQDRRCRANVAASVGASLPARITPSAPLRMVMMPPTSDETAITPLAEGTMIIPLPSGARLRFDWKIDPDLATNSCTARLLGPSDQEAIPA